MERYEVLIKPSAVKEIERIGTRKDRRMVVSRIGALADDPRPLGCEKLTARERYRVRQGWYRIVYAVDDSRRTVVVVKVGHRRDVYR
ncbi:MAG: type II toxin-antitoxin system RelE family toxin [Planctomycetota bacterium]|jgi:mRNA interferase RelE/StbE